MSDETKLLRVTGLISLSSYEKMSKLVDSKLIPISRLVAIAIEHEMQLENPFDYDCTLPDEEYINLAFVQDAAKILDYMKTTSGMSLDMFCLMRHDIGIPDKKTFLLAFRECVVNGFLETYKPKQHANTKFKYPDSYVFYRIKGANKPENKKIRRDATQFETYQKLKKKFKE